MFNQGCEKYPDSPLLYNNYGLTLMYSGDIAMARKMFNTVLQLDENAIYAMKNTELLNSKKENHE